MTVHDWESTCWRCGADDTPDNPVSHTLNQGCVCRRCVAEQRAEREAKALGTRMVDSAILVPLWAGAVALYGYTALTIWRRSDWFTVGRWWAEMHDREER